MEKSFREKITDLFNEAESDNSPFEVSITRLFIWLAVMTMVSSLTTFVFPSGYPLIQTHITLIILILATAHPAFKWAIKHKQK